ncbi:MAG: ATP-dependent DNA helicase, partial [Caldilineaceae bacterium SB0675_bin_29]|nr:ATP-dependent DNA helicase [Caldilineaceae bacterium SB0675_bin_29]
MAEMPDEFPQSTVEEKGEPYGGDSGENDPSPLEAADLGAYFDAGGRLSSLMEDYERRPGQLEMAEVVKRAVLERRPALIEAPTGTGKSIAYLLPAILSECTVVVATAKKSLQDQLFRKDIPFLRQVLNRPIDAIVVKGRSNYICSYKWEKEAVERKRLAFLDAEDQQAAFLHSWLESTDSGDVDDLPFVLKSDLRPRIVSFPDDCIGRSCLHFDDNCFVNQLRAKARNAQVIITNHHLLLNALELGEMGQAILPEAAIYVLDEAHQLEDTATSVF